MKMSSFISQVVVFGEGKTYLTALITLNQEEIIRFANDNKLSFSDYAELTKKQEIIDLIQGEIDKGNKELSKIESIRKFIILEREFSQAHGEVTPTFKTKRNNVTEIYEDMVKSMYES